MILQYKPVIDRIKLAIEVSDYILSDGYFTEYKKTEEFEKRIAEFLGVKYCFTTNNGTISLVLALLAYEIKPGDKVLVPNITMIATCSAVRLIGAIPVFVDIDPSNGCMDLEDAARHIENDPSIKAFIYVTLNGRCHKVETLFKFVDYCLDCGLFPIYDNAQSLGSKDINNNYISNFGDGIGSFSFSMPKIISTGQGGCLVCNHQYPGKFIKRLKDFGRDEGGLDIHNHFGINSKFTEIQAIMGLNQFRDIGHRIEEKKRIYVHYRTHLQNIPEVKFLEWGEFNHTPWFIDVYVERRLELIAYLQGFDIKTRAMYPELTTQKCNGIPYSLKNSKKFAETGLWLPSSIDIKIEDIMFVCDKIREFYNGK